MSGRRLITVVAFATLGCGWAAPAHADVGVTVANNAFSPASVTIMEGEVVNWTFAGPDTNHSVTSVATNEQRGSFDSNRNDPSPAHAPGTKFSHEFEFVGDYAYFCKVHPDTMRGRVIVRDRVNNPNPPPADVSPPRFSSRRFSLRKRRFTFRLNEPAAITARLRGPTRRTRRFDGKVGRNTVKLPRRLKSGRYALTIVAIDGSDNVRRYTRRFRVPKRS
jgi:plastocyanin